jgi:hypothetical protein
MIQTLTVLPIRRASAAGRPVAANATKYCLKKRVVKYKTSLLAREFNRGRSCDIPSGLF